MYQRNPIYLDYQASTPLNGLAANAMKPYNHNAFANPHSSQHLSGIYSSQAIEASRQTLADLIGADSNEIIFTSGATEANNLAILGLRNSTSNRKRILVSAIEHKCVLAPAEYMINLGFKVEYIPVDETGVIDLNFFAQMLNDDVLLVSVMSVNNETGSIQPINECAAMAREYGAYFHTDAAQAPLHMDIDVYDLGVDLLSLSSHKMYGPKGIGLLYIAHDVQDKLTPIIFGGGQERDLRSGTLPTALCVGFGSAANILSGHKQDFRNNVRSLRDYFWNKLVSNNLGLSLIGQDLDTRHIGNLCISFENIDADELLGVIQADVAASNGSACSSGNIEPSHVLTAMGLSDKTIAGSVRFSFGSGLSKSDIDEAIQFIIKALDKCR